MSGETGGTDELDEIIAKLKSARANGDPEKYTAMVTVAEAHRIAAALTSLRAELSLALDTVDMNYHHCQQAEERAEAAEQHVAALVGALRFYAENDRYDYDPTCCPVARTKKRMAELEKSGGFVLGDGGEIARAALASEA